MVREDARELEQTVGPVAFDQIFEIIQQTEALLNEELGEQFPGYRIVIQFARLNWNTDQVLFEDLPIGRWHYDHGLFTIATPLTGMGTEVAVTDANEFSWMHYTYYDDFSGGRDIPFETQMTAPNATSIWRGTGYSRHVYRRSGQIHPPLLHRSPRDRGPRLVLLQSAYLQKIK